MSRFTRSKGRFHFLISAGDYVLCSRSERVEKILVNSFQFTPLLPSPPLLSDIGTFLVCVKQMMLPQINKIMLYLRGKCQHHAALRKLLLQHIASVSLTSFTNIGVRLSNFWVKSTFCIGPDKHLSGWSDSLWPSLSQIIISDWPLSFYSVINCRISRAFIIRAAFLTQTIS